MHIYTKLLFVISLKFKFSWTSRMVSGEPAAVLPTPGAHAGMHRKQETHSGHRKQHEGVWEDCSKLNYAKWFSPPNFTGLGASVFHTKLFKKQSDIYGVLFLIARVTCAFFKRWQRHLPRPFPTVWPRDGVHVPSLLNMNELVIHAQEKQQK